MAQLKYRDKHNQVGFLRKPDESAGFAEIVDFLRGSNLRLQLADASGITMLPNNEIFEGMGHMGYPTDGSFTFWKSFFTPQWRFLVHHILHCISSKSGGWDQFGSNIATALICLSTGRVYNFSKLIFDGMVANLKSKTKFLMYPRFLQMILDIQTENKHPYLAVTLTKKIFGNMKRGFRGVPRPLLPAMLSIVDPSAGQEAPSVTQPQPSSSVIPPTPPTTQPIPSEAITIPPLSQPAPPTPIAETTTAFPSPSPSPAQRSSQLTRNEIQEKEEFQKNLLYCLDFEEVNLLLKILILCIKVSSGIEEINAGSLDVNTGIDPVTTEYIKSQYFSRPDVEERKGSYIRSKKRTQASRKNKRTNSSKKKQTC
ncbi:hypothetical protein Tco_1186001 [Tanacetum coccineum]